MVFPQVEHLINKQTKSDFYKDNIQPVTVSFLKKKKKKRTEMPLPALSVNTAKRIQLVLCGYSVQ